MPTPESPPAPVPATGWYRRLLDHPFSEWAIVAVGITVLAEIANPVYTIVSGVDFTAVLGSSQPGPWPVVARIGLLTAPFLWSLRAFLVLLAWIFALRRKGLGTHEAQLLGRVFGAPVARLSDHLGGPRLTRVLAHPLLLILVSWILFQASLWLWLTLFG